MDYNYYILYIYFFFLSILLILLFLHFQGERSIILLFLSLCVFLLSNCFSFVVSMIFFVNKACDNNNNNRYQQINRNILKDQFIQGAILRILWCQESGHNWFIMYFMVPGIHSKNQIYEFKNYKIFNNSKINTQLYGREVFKYELQFLNPKQQVTLPPNTPFQIQSSLMLPLNIHKQEIEKQGKARGMRRRENRSGTG